jgi:hypothetical protein
MHATTITSVVLTTLLAAVRAQNITNGELGSAAVVSNNPAGATYLAVLPEKEFFNPEDPRGNIKGSVSATSSPDGVGVVFSVSVSNFPTSGGPFSMCYTTTPRRPLSNIPSSLPYPRCARFFRWQLYQNTCAFRSLHPWRSKHTPPHLESSFY